MKKFSQETFPGQAVESTPSGLSVLDVAKIAVMMGLPAQVVQGSMLGEQRTSNVCEPGVDEASIEGKLLQE